MQRSPGPPTLAGEAELRAAAGAPSGVDEEREDLLGNLRADYDGRGDPQAHHRAHSEGDCCPSTQISSSSEPGHLLAGR